MTRFIFSAGYTPREVMRATGIRYSTLNLWATTGFIKPSIDQGTGTGHERIYSFTDLVAVKLALELRKVGIKTASLRKIISTLVEQEIGNAILRDAKLVVSGDDVVLTDDRRLKRTLSQAAIANVVLVIDLPKALGPNFIPVKG